MEDDIPEGAIPNTFAPNCTNKYFTTSGLIACLRAGGLNGIKLPPEAKKMLREWRPISRGTPIDRKIQIPVVENAKLSN